eukprot:CAMPEP_0117428772 /NCGR_PEP_ID=MMETSP0758-20121206/8405_1 /TAXON_ID=63605 /ORGANISM="Percolomonas cosmopolitus, Strain AE-1 (ATCC 50343)" /LENGTH=599 /DNA_ID=CAMNT_0005215313 /DNA_START=395 /DNA_END=2191 /DNA_ORIENTATION=+
MTKEEDYIEKTWIVRKSPFPNRPATVHFSMQYSDDIDENEAGIKKRVVKSKKKEKQLGVFYKFHQKQVEFGVIKNAFERAGLIRAKDDSDDWNILWGKHLKPYQFYKLNRYQKVNHFPGSLLLGSKTNMHRYLKYKKEKHKKHYSIFPEGYFYPKDEVAIKKQLEKGNFFLSKPSGTSCGNGIVIVRSIDEIPKDEETGECAHLIQTYLADPLLIDKKKFDLRVYVLCTSFNPLRVYIYENGLARFCTEDYDPDSNSRFCHLTNYSVNKHSDAFVKNMAEGDECEGSKWSIKALKKYFESTGYDDTELWENVNDVIIKTLISIEHEVVSMLKRYTPKYRSQACFELYGFDIFIDADYKPWVIEVNLGPSLATGSPIDLRIKGNLLTDILDMIGIVSFDREKTSTGSNTIEDIRRRREKKRKKEEREEQERNAQELKGLRPPSTPTSDSSSTSSTLSHTLSQLCSKKYKLKTLSKRDIKLICEFEEELIRSEHGGFSLAFPKDDSKNYYKQFFNKYSYNNALLWKWLQTSEAKQESLKSKFMKKIKKKKKKKSSTSKKKSSTKTTTKKKKKRPSTTCHGKRKRTKKLALRPQTGQQSRII